MRTAKPKPEPKTEVGVTHPATKRTIGRGRRADSLSRRSEIARYLREGRSTDEIADLVSLTVGSVRLIVKSLEDEWRRSVQQDLAYWRARQLQRAETMIQTWWAKGETDVRAARMVKDWMQYEDELLGIREAGSAQQGQEALALVQAKSQAAQPMSVSTSAEILRILESVGQLDSQLPPRSTMSLPVIELAATIGEVVDVSD